MEFQNFTYRELQNLCKDFGLRANGKSEELKVRLRDYKLKLQASSTSHRRSSANMNLPLPLMATKTDDDEAIEAPEVNENENQNKSKNKNEAINNAEKESSSPSTTADNGDEVKEKQKARRRKSSIVATFMEHIANSTKALSLNASDESKQTNENRHNNQHTTTTKTQKQLHETAGKKSTVIPRMTIKSLTMNKPVVKTSSSGNKDSKPAMKSTIPKAVPLATKAPKQIQVNKPLSWKPHTGKLKEFNVETKSIIREAGPYEKKIINSKATENENSNNLNLNKTKYNSNINGTFNNEQKKNNGKSKKVLGINKPLTYKPHTGKLKPVDF